MAPDALKIEFRPAEWSWRVQSDLQQIAAHEPRDIAAFRSQIEADEMHLLEVFADGGRVGSLVWSICPEHDGPVMVVNAFAARPIAGVSLAKITLERFRQFAALAGCHKVRCWTKRAGLARVFEEAGGGRSWHVMEVNADGR